MAKKQPERTKEEMGAFFDAFDDFNDYASRQIEKQMKEEEEAKKKKKADKKVKDAMGVEED